ncbi:hypothetical protein T484DRAFT_1811525 [Baffinella frigidus]|nr:hypothetical protein T484DRAFT_1811525 [Cryptophyta sp. CCMP2293]
MVKKEVQGLGQMAEAIKAMPQYKELVSKYSLHMEITKNCMIRYEEQNLEEVSGVEQNVATGLDVQGKPVKKPAAAAALALLLANPTIKAGDKLRLILIFVSSFVSPLPSSPHWGDLRVESQEEATVLLHAANLTHAHRAVATLRVLCESAWKEQELDEASYKKKLGVFSKSTSKGLKDTQVSYDLARYRPPLEVRSNFISEDN